MTVEATFEQLYSITIGDATGGSAQPSATAAKSGDNVTIQASPDAGMIFGHWTTTGITLPYEQKIANPLTITMPTNAITITPNYLQAEVVVGDVIWAATNSIPTTAAGGTGTGGTATFQPNPYVYDGANQINWYRATGAADGDNSGTTAGRTAPGVCPDGWRLPTSVEYLALIQANSTPFVLSGGTEEASVYVNDRKADGSGYNTAAQTGTIAGEVFVVGGQRLFFPTSGNNDGTSGRVSLGYYMVSTQHPTLAANFRMFYVRYTANIYPAYSSIAKSSLVSVRCVRTRGETYSLAAITSTGAFISPTPSSPQPAGTPISLSAPTVAGYTFAGWTLSGLTPSGGYTASSNPLVVAMPSDNNGRATAKYVVTNPVGEIRFVLSTGTIAFARTNLSAPGTFASNETDYGKHFQWGSNIAYTYNIAAQPPIPPFTDAAPNTRTTWPADQNPCPTGWRLPTSIEWFDMLNLESFTPPGMTAITGQYTTITSQTGGSGPLRIVPKKAGGDTNMTLTLPAAGYINPISAGEGTHGHYHASDIYPYAVNCIFVFNFIPDAPTGGIGNGSVNIARSVRCVRSI